MSALFNKQTVEIIIKHDMNPDHIVLAQKN